MESRCLYVFCKWVISNPWYSRGSTSRIDQSRYVTTKLLVTDVHAQSPVSFVYIYCIAVDLPPPLGLMFNDRKTWKRNIRHTSNVCTRRPLNVKQTILSFLKTRLCRLSTVYFVSQDNGFSPSRHMPLRWKLHSNLNLSEFLVRKTSYG